MAPPPPKSADSSSLSAMDMKPWMENNEIKRFTQDNWILKYNKAEKIMASAADYYGAAQLGDEAIASVQEDFKSWVMTSTRIIYNQDNLEGKINYYHGSNVVKPVEREMLIPDYSNSKLIKDILDTAEGLSFVQGLFLTGDDSKEEILEILGKLSNKKSNELKIWTPSQNSRKSLSQRAVSLGYIGGGFRVSADDDPDDSDGRSRAVAASAVSLEARSAESAENSNQFNMESSIDKKSKSVCFSSMQAIGDFNKYTAMFCFHDKRYVMSSIFDIGEVPNINTRIAGILSKNKSTAEKLQKISSFLHPVYAHLALYSKGKHLDDAEYFEDMEAEK